MTTTTHYRSDQNLKLDIYIPKGQVSLSFLRREVARAAQEMRDAVEEFNHKGWKLASSGEENEEEGKLRATQSTK